MKIFLDSANIEEIKEINNLGIIDGITTNPSLIAKNKCEFRDTISNICKIISSDVSVEVTANDFESMIEQAEYFMTIASNIVVKLPMTWEGLKACKKISSEGVKVNMTLCFSANQALLAAKAGATYVSPFVGRLDDIGQDGMKLIQDIRQIYNHYKDYFQTKILAASIRSPQHVYLSALHGADIATISGKIIKQLLDHPLTISGLEIFNKDWTESKLEI